MDVGGSACKEFTVHKFALFIPWLYKYVAV